MSKNKIKKMVKKEKEETDVGLRSITIVVAILIIVCIGMYYLTENILAKDNKPKDSVSEDKSDYDWIIFGNLFTRPYDEYYALVLDYNKDYSTFNSLVSNYNLGANSLKVFYIDSQDYLNDKYMKPETNLNAKTLEEIEIKDTGVTLIHIKNSKIVKIEDEDPQIRKLLQYQK